jgi:hypothetical protein
MAANDGMYHGGEHGDPSPMVRLVTPGATDLPEGPCRALNCSEEGEITFTDLTGNELTDYFVSKGENAIGAKRVTAVSGTMVVWALY